MKNLKLQIIIVALFFFGVNQTFAQISAGTIMAGGNIGFSKTQDKQKVAGTTTEGSKHTTLNFSPAVGYFLIDNLALGLKFNIASHTTKFESNGFELKDRNSDLTLGPFVRYYYLFSDNMGVFVHGDFGIGRTKSRDERVIRNNNTDLIRVDESSRGVSSYNIGPGFVFFLNESIGLETTLFYSGRRIRDENTAGEKIVDMNGGLVFNIGIQAYLGRD